MLNSITDVKGLKVGHASNYDGYTGCTVILCETGATCGIDIRGSASGTRQVDARVLELRWTFSLSWSNAEGFEKR